MAQTQDTGQGQRANGRAKLFALLSDGAGNAPEAAPATAPKPTGKTLKIEKVTTREARKEALVRHHADAIEKLRARKALAAERDALVADVLEQDDFNLPATS